MTGIIITLLIVFYKISLINLLGDKGMGYYSIALGIYLFLMTCISYGLPKAIATLLITQSSQGQYRIVNKTITSSFIYALLFGGITGILLFVGAEFIATHLMNATFSVFTIRMFAPAVLLISILSVFHGIYTGTKADRISNLAHYIEEISVVVLSIVGGYFFTGIGVNIANTKSELLYEPAYGSMGAAIGFSIGIFITCIFVLVIFIKYRKKLLRMLEKEDDNKTYDVPTNRELITVLLKTMLPFVLTLAFYHLSNLMDYIVFNHMMSVQGHKENSYIILLGMLNGKYEFFISIPLLFVSWYAVSKVPILTHIAKDGNKRKIHNKIAQSLRHTMIYIIPSTLVLILYARPLMNLLFAGINDTPSVLLRTGAVSIVFYSLATISNAALNAIDEWKSVMKNVILALCVHTVSLLIMMIVLQWGIVAVVISRIVFAACVYILNEHTLRERTGYVQEHKRTFTLPLLASMIMGGVSLIIYVILKLFLTAKFAVIVALFVAFPLYIFSLIFIGGITQREMYRLPGGKILAPLCRKLHLIK